MAADPPIPKRPGQIKVVRELTPEERRRVLDLLPPSIVRTLTDPNLTKRPLGWAGRFYQRYPLLRPDMTEEADPT